MRWLPSIALLAACSKLMVPSYVTTADVDNAIAKGNYEVACVGLKMKSDELRTHTAQQLAIVPDETANACICEALEGRDPLEGYERKWDKAVAEGLRGSDRDEVVGCLAAMVERENLPDRAEALGILARTKAPVTRTTLVKLATSPGDVAIRAAALRAMNGDKNQKDTLTALATKDSEPKIRAAAAAALGGLAAADESVATLLEGLATSDAEGEVRAEALASMRQSKSKASSALACKMMMDDPAAQVRGNAVLSFRGTKDPDELACLRKRAMAEEEDAQVRQAILDAIKSSPTKESGQILCDAIPFWLKTYLDRGLPEQIPGTDIIRAQNDRDWDASFGCVQKALKASGGYSCYAKQYAGTWFQELGGTAFIPKCPPAGM